MRQKPFMVPGKCDITCAWCNIQGTLPHDVRWDFNRLTRELRRLAAQGVCDVEFGHKHSEPTTHPDFPRVMSRAKSMGFKTINLLTSGIALSDPACVRQLKACGLTSVQIVMPGLDEDIADALLGRSGATAAKMAAVENVAAEGLGLNVVLLFVRPALRTMNRSFRDLRSRLKRWPNVGIRGQLLTSVPMWGADRYELLYPRYGEVAWAMKGVRSVAESGLFPLFGQNDPLCVRLWIGDILDRPSAVPGVLYKKPRKLCSHCELSAECPGISADYLKTYGLDGLAKKEIVPADVDMESLRKDIERTKSKVSRTSCLSRAKVRKIKELLDGVDQELCRIVQCRSRYDGDVIRVSLAGKDFGLFLAPRETYRGSFYLKIPSFAVCIRGEASMTPAEDRLLRSYVRLLARRDGEIKAIFGMSES